MADQQSQPINKPAAAQSAKPASAAGQKPTNRPQGPTGPQVPKKEYGKDYRGIVRVAGKELAGDLTLERGLGRIRGIGLNLAKNLSAAIERELNISRKKHVGDLTDDEITKVEELLRTPEKFIKETYKLNRPIDPDTGATRHLIANDLMFATRQDVQFEKDTRSYKGWRFTMGQRVRGQHGRTTGRTGISVGVLKKALKAQKTAAASKAQGSAPAAKEKK